MEDFCDGHVFQSHPLFTVHCHGLQLFLYYDDVEVCNPLGSKRKIHKLGVFLCIVFIVPNVANKFNTLVSWVFFCSLHFKIQVSSILSLETLHVPKYRSRISSIQLLGIVKKSVIDEYGMNSVLQPFVNDFKRLVRLRIWRSPSLL